MLNIESKAIYDILSEITGNSEVYKIVDADEINDRLPENITLTKVQLSQIIRDLKDRDYVDIKYFTPDEYCLRIIKHIEQEESESGESESAPVTAESDTDESGRQLYAPRKSGGNARPGLVLFMSFLGGVLGSGFVAAITAILLKFVI